MMLETELHFRVQFIEQVEISLLKPFVQKELPQMSFVIREFVVLRLHPGKEGRIVRMLDSLG